MHPLTLMQLLILHVYLTSYIWPITIVGYISDSEHRVVTLYVETSLPPDALECSAAMALAGVANVAMTLHHKYSRKRRVWTHAVEVSFAR